MKRLPLYLLIDTSGSMRGEPIEAVKVGLQALVASLRQDPYALETVHISVLGFDRDVRVYSSLTSVEEFIAPELETPDSGPTHLGEALVTLCARLDAEVRVGTREVRGDWKALVFLMTDGSPSDLQRYREAIPEVRRRPVSAIHACAAGAKASAAMLRELTPSVLSLDTTDSGSFLQLFRWVSASVAAGSRSMGLPTPTDGGEGHPSFPAPAADDGLGGGGAATS